MALDRKALITEALDDWHEFRDSLAPHEQSRVYAEMTGWFIHHDPISFSEFVASQREYRARRAEFDAFDAEEE